MTNVQPISVGEVKRRFSDVLGSVRYHKQRYVIERNGTPVAALVPLEDLPEQSAAPTGFLALVGAFDDAPELSAVLDDTVARRAEERSRPAVRLTP